MATVSRDGTWKFWDVDGKSFVTVVIIIEWVVVFMGYIVQYKRREDPKLLVTGKVSSCGETLVSLAPDSRVVAVAVNMSLYIYSTASGELLETLDNVHRGKWK